MSHRPVTRLAVALAIVVMTPAARAINYTWSGSGVSDWRDSTKWNPNVGYPGSVAGDSAAFPQFSNGAVTLRGALTLDGLAIQTSSISLTLSANPTDGPASLTATTFPSSSSQLTLTSTGGPADASVTTSSGTFFNIGQLSLLPGAGGARTFDAPNVINDGAISVATNARIGRVGAGSLQNGTGSVGLVAIGAGATLVTNQYLQQGTNTNTYLSGGTLDVATGPVQFTGGRVSGRGTISDALTAANTKIEPRDAPGGAAPGTLSALDDVTLGNNAQLDLLLGAPGDASLLDVEGDLNLTGSGITMTLTGGVAGQTYTVVRYTGARTGTFVANTPGYTLDYAIAGEIRVTVAPEPGTLALCATGALALLQRRRRAGSLHTPTHAGTELAR